MNDDGLQGMLFASTDEVEPPATATDEMRLCAINVNSPSRQRAEQLLGWLLATGCNSLVLTEMRPSEGGVSSSAVWKPAATR